MVERAWPDAHAHNAPDRPTDLTHWSAVWAAVGVVPAPATYEQLLAHYAEPHRAYHARRHIDECLHFAAAARALCAHPDEVALALWFHDAIYEPARTDNEARSADWLGSLAAERNVSPAVIERLRALIMATCHDAEPQDQDACVLVDIDLAILGAPAARFDEYEQQIRREYRWVPGPIYRAKRANVLQKFLARSTIYATAPFRARFEESARANIARSLARLKKPV